MLHYSLRIVQRFLKRPFFLAFAASIGTVSSATFARYLLNIINSGIGRQGATVCFWVLATPLLFFLGCKAPRGNFATLAVAGAVLLFSLQLNIVEERIHLLQYGLIGLLWTHAFICLPTGQKLLWSALAGAIAGLATACLDESIQDLLPYRVGDLRDIGFDFVGCAAGVLTRVLHERTINETIQSNGPLKEV